MKTRSGWVIFVLFLSFILAFDASAARKAKPVIVENTYEKPVPITIADDSVPAT